MFRTVLLPIIRSFYCTRSNGICHTGLLTASEQYEDGTEKLVHLVGFIISNIYIYIYCMKCIVNTGFLQTSTERQLETSPDKISV